MTAKEIAGALGGRKMGAVWMARCPTHDDREPSLSIRDADDGKVLVRCHAGCDQQRVIAELRARSLGPMAVSARFGTRPAPSSSSARRTNMTRTGASLRSAFGTPLVRHRGPWWRSISPRAASTCHHLAHCAFMPA